MNQQDKNYWICQAMLEKGGSFIKAFAECYLKADMYNKILLKPVLNKYRKSYQDLAIALHKNYEINGI